MHGCKSEVEAIQYNASCFEEDSNRLGWATVMAGLTNSVKGSLAGTYLRPLSAVLVFLRGLRSIEIDPEQFPASAGKQARLVGFPTFGE